MEAQDSINVFFEDVSVSSSSYSSLLTVIFNCLVESFLPRIV